MENTIKIAKAYTEKATAAVAAAEQKLADLKAQGGRMYDILCAERDIESAKKKVAPRYVCEVCYSDRHAYEIIEIKSATTMLVRQLDAKRTDDRGMSESQEWAFTSNENRPIITLRARKRGGWSEAGNCNTFCITEEPYEYYDFSF